MTDFHRFAALALFVPVALTGCATTDGNQGDYLVQDLSSREEVICKRQRHLGSHIPVTVCRTRAQIEADQQAAMRSVGPMRPTGGSEPRRPPN